jgi:hypothetical protein
VAANVEEFTLKLGLQVSGGVDTAMAQLQRRIMAEQQALAGLGVAANAARAKLAELQSAGAAGKAAGIEKQGQAVDALAESLDYVKRQIAAVAAAGNGGDVGALAKMKTDAADLSGKLEQARAKMAALQAAGHGNAGAQSSQQQKIAGIESKQGAGQSAIAQLEASAPKLKAAEDAAKAASGAVKEGGASFRQLGAAAGETDGALGNVVRMIGKFKAAGPAGIVLAIVGVMILLVTAAVAAAVALVKFGLAMADASRSSRLLSGAAAGGVVVGAELEAVINDVANKVPLARDKIAEMGRALEIAHLQGRNMQNALEAATTAASAVGDAAGESFKTIAESSQKARRFLLTKQDLEGTGVAFADVAASLATQMGITTAAATSLIQRGAVSVKDGLEAMNAAVQGKFGKTVAAQMLSLDVQFAKLKENLGRLFNGVDIEPFLRGLATITQLFREDSVTGEALHTLFVTIFNPLAEASEGIFPVISAFLRGMVIAVLAGYVAFLKVKAAINDAFGGDTTSKIDWIKVGMYAGIIAVGLMFGALVALAVIIALVIVVCVPLAIALSLPFLIPLVILALLILGIYELYDAISSVQIPDLGIESAFNDALAYLDSIDLSDVAAQIINSLADGLMSAASKVGDAMKSIGKTILAALPSVLVMHSPSVLLTAQAKMAAGSIVNPLKDAKDDAHKAMADLGGGRPDFGGAKGGAPKAASEGRRVVFEKGAIEFHGTREDMPLFMRMLKDAIEIIESESPEPA